MLETMLPSPTAEVLIKELQLTPHPEGGYYKEIYRANHNVKSGAHEDAVRSASTSIYYLLKGSEFSAWHKIKSDEVWHYYKGCALTIYILNSEGEITTHILGDPTVTIGASFQIVTPANHWFAAQPNEHHSYTLVGCTVAPGFEFIDFEFASLSDLKKVNSKTDELFIKFL